LRAVELYKLGHIVLPGLVSRHAIGVDDEKMDRRVVAFVARVWRSAMAAEY
jgi:hypothetical protein